MTGSQDTSGPLAIRLIGRSRADTGLDGPSVAPVAALRGGWFTGVTPVVVGGLIVALAYAAGRDHDRAATALYWVGQALIWGPSIGLLLSRRADVRTRVAVLLAIAGVQAMLVWAYSPDQFRFADEFQHLRTLDDILRTHHLFTPNSFLPVSPPFPGLEIVTQALMTFSGLSAFTSGTVIDTVSHLLLPLFIFFGLRELTDEDRASSLAAFIYSTAPHYSYLEVLFIYSTPALIFFALAFRSLMRVARGRSRVLTIVLPFVPMVLTHHLTTLIWLVLLIGVVVVVALTRPVGLAIRLAVAAAALIGATVVWIAAMSPSTFAYLGQPAVATVDTLTGTSHRAASTAVATAVGAAPSWESLVAILGAGLLLVISTSGAALTLWSNAGRTAALVSVLGLVYPAVLVVRLVAPDGGDLASRMLTYAMVLIAYPAAVALAALWDSRFTVPARAAAGAVVAVLVVAGIVSGLPPSYERIPGRFEVDAFESGIDDRITQVGQWAASVMRPGARVLCDFSACSTIGGDTQATISGAGSQVYYAPTVDKLNAAIGDQTLSYVQTDLRWTQQLPPTGEYWSNDSRSGDHVHPLGQAVLERFDQDPELDRVYDDGDVRVYYTAPVWSP